MELKDMMEKAKEAKNPNELLALAKEADIEMSPQEAEENFALLNKKGELSDEELDNVAGGGCDTSVGGKSYTVVSSGLNCFTGQYEANYRVTSVSFMIGSEPLNYEYDGPLYAPDNQKLRETWLSFTSLKEGKQQCGSCRWLSFKGGIGYCSRSGK